MEMKLRAFDYIENELRDIEAINFYDETYAYINSHNEWTEVTYDNNHTEIIQCSGYKDIHQDDMWEGDIIRVEMPNMGAGIKSYYGVMSRVEGSFRIGKGCNYYIHHESFKYEVVGSIYDKQDVIKYGELI